jgi:hypothetical protein
MSGWTDRLRAPKDALVQRVRAPFQSLRHFAYRVRERSMCRTYTEADGTGVAVVGPPEIVTSTVRLYLESTDVETLASRRAWKPMRTAAFARRAQRQFGLVVFDPAAVPHELATAVLPYAQWLNMIIPLPDNSHAYLAQRTGDFRYRLRRALRAGYRFEVTRDPAWVQEFHARYFLPSMRLRHGDDGYVDSPGELANLLARHGSEWVKVVRDGECVAAAIGERLDGTYAFRKIGWRDGSQALFDGDIISVVYWSVLQRALELGSCAFHLGATPADLRNGLFYFKERWGGVLQPELKGVWPRALFIDPAHRHAHRFLMSRALLVQNDSASFTVLSGLTPRDIPSYRGQSHLISTWLQLRSAPDGHARETEAHQRLPAALRPWFAAIPLPPREEQIP